MSKSIKERYSFEIAQISERLIHLEKGYFRDHVSSSGNSGAYVSTIVMQLRKELNELLHLIEKDLNSPFTETMNDIFTKTDAKK